MYNALPAAGTPNVPSIGFEATSVSEFGDAITLDGTARKLNAVTVTMSSWACQSGTWAGDCLTAPGAHFTVPITLNTYDAPVTQGDGTVVPGDLIARATKTFKIAYRPSTNHNKCTGGEWYSKSADACFNGKAQNITWNFTSLAMDLPDTGVIGVAYNTTSNGYHPIGTSASCYGTVAGCPYDALNVGTNDSVSLGSKPYPDTAFQNTSWSAALCDSTPALGEFNLDFPTSACWGGYNPAIRVTAH